MNNNTFDKVFDALLDEAANDYVNDMGSMLDSEPVQDVEFSEEHTRRINKFFAQRRRSQKIIKFSKFATRAACVLLVLLVASTAAIFSVEAWRNTVINYVFDPDAPGTFLGFGDNDGGEYYCEKGMWLKYIPKGFVLKEDGSNNRHINLLFVDENDNYFSVGTRQMDGIWNVDTEDAEVKEIVINGQKAITITSYKANAIIWYDNMFSYTIHGNIAQQELLKIVKNIEMD